MTREQAQIVRLVLMCAAYAVAETLTIGSGLTALGSVIALALAAGVYVLTDDLGRARSGGEARYWRGRRIDDDRRGGRWN